MESLVARAIETLKFLSKKALEGAEAQGAETDFISLAGMRINPCIGCEDFLTCSERQCIFDDDMVQIYLNLTDIDDIIIGAPIYYGGIAAQAKAMMERLNGLGNKARERLRLKVGGAIGVAGARHGGQELALWTIINFFNVMDIVPVGITAPHTQLGATGIALSPGSIEEDRWVHWRTKEEISSLDMARMLGTKVAIMAKIIKQEWRPRAYRYQDSTKWHRAVLYLIWHLIVFSILFNLYLIEKGIKRFGKDTNIC